MDSLTAVSTPPAPGSGTVKAPQKIDDSGEPVSSVTAITTAAVTPPQAPEPAAPEHQQQISNAVKDINSFFQAAQRSIGFSLDETSGHMVMQIRDTNTNEIIRQIPGEDAIKLAKQLDDLTGILFKARA